MQFHHLIMIHLLLKLIIFWIHLNFFKIFITAMGSVALKILPNIKQLIQSNDGSNDLITRPVIAVVNTTPGIVKKGNAKYIF